MQLVTIDMISNRVSTNCERTTPDTKKISILFIHVVNSSHKITRYTSVYVCAVLRSQYDRLVNICTESLSVIYT